MDWLKKNNQWYRTEYKRAYDIAMGVIYGCLGLMIIAAIWTRMTGGIVIGSDMDNWLRPIFFIMLTIVIASLSIAFTVSTVDRYEKKIAEQAGHRIG